MRTHPSASFIQSGQKYLRTPPPSKQAAEDSLLKFLKTGVAFALESVPRNLTFLEGMHPYISRLSEGKSVELSPEATSGLIARECGAY